MNWLDDCHFGDCRDTMRAMIADGVKVNVVVTSPPYWGLRRYLPTDAVRMRHDLSSEQTAFFHAELVKIGLHPNRTAPLRRAQLPRPLRPFVEPAPEIGREPTLGAFIDTLVEVFTLVRQLMADDGTLWLNMGDSYAAHRSYQVPSTLMNGDATNQAQAAGGRRVPHGLKPKDLVGQPWRLAFALQDTGWYLRQDIIWHKPNPMPESVRDRCTKAHEYVFLLSKLPTYYFDAQAIAQPLAASSIARLSQATLGQQHGSNRVQGKSNGPMKAVGARFGGVKYGADEHDESRTKSGKDWVNATGCANRRSVWSIPTQAYRGAHFSTFPEALVEPCVLAGSCPGGIVFDPFFGSGTTGQVAKRLGRHFIGCELNPDYEPLQRHRLG
ncbi:MAG TPA: site-specific DNA-methyltransferase [Rhodanobacter sp.]|nr:site-specific DNA-methyltransferase [Rhodanobacter sp.]